MYEKKEKNTITRQHLARRKMDFYTPFGLSESRNPNGKKRMDKQGIGRKWCKWLDKRNRLEKGIKDRVERKKGRKEGIASRPGGESRRRRIDYLARLCANETAAARKYDRR